MGVLDEWVESGTTEIALPSGRWVKWKEPHAARMLQRDLMPQSLRQRVLASGSDASGPDADLTDRIQERFEQELALVSLCIRAVRKSKDDPWELGSPTPEQLENGVPLRDLNALIDIVRGRTTPRSVTAIVRYKVLGEISEDDAARIVEEEAAGTVEGWESFRRVRRGVDPGTPSQDVGQPAVDAGGDKRPRRRARAG